MCQIPFVRLASSQHSFKLQGHLQFFVYFIRLWLNTGLWWQLQTIRSAKIGPKLYVIWWPFKLIWILTLNVSFKVAWECQMLPNSKNCAGFSLILRFWTRAVSTIDWISWSERLQKACNRVVLRVKCMKCSEMHYLASMTGSEFEVKS